MAECFNQYFLHNGKVLERDVFELPVNFSILLYEVIRVINGRAVFIEDHIERLLHSAKIKEVSQFFINSEVANEIDMLINSNKHIDGNIKLEYYIQGNNCERFLYYIKHSYPSIEMYQKGVTTISYKAIRSNPNVKQLHVSIKENIDKLFKDNDIYEVLLVNENGFITEGSKSNIFFIKGRTLYTASDELVLKGITRKFVIQAILNLGFEIKFEAVSIENIEKFDAVFLCGTSPKVLAINQINNIQFLTSNNILQAITDEYDRILNNSTQKMKI